MRSIFLSATFLAVLPVTALAAARGLSLLSMGMSGDFEMAVRYGATHVRVGTALFGARDPASARG